MGEINPLKFCISVLIIRFKLHFHAIIELFFQYLHKYMKYMMHL